ncbi:MAG: PqqD family protein [Pyrinomonadaceae bacterium]
MSDGGNVIFSENDRENYSGICPEAKSREVVVQISGDELLIYNLKTNQAVCLNKTAALVWKYCDGKTDLGSIAARLESDLRSPIDPELVLLALKELQKADLIKNNETIPTDFGVFSRRDVVKKIGYGALIALPVVSSITAPSAASAQSVCFNANGAPAGTVINPFTNCVGPVASCLNVCINQTNAPTACQNCSAALQGGATECTFQNPCVCVCA